MFLIKAITDFTSYSIVSDTDASSHYEPIKDMVVILMIYIDDDLVKSWNIK